MNKFQCLSVGKIHKAVNLVLVPDSPKTQSCISVSLKALFGDFPAQLNLLARPLVIVAESIRLITLSMLVPPINARRVI